MSLVVVHRATPCCRPMAPRGGILHGLFFAAFGTGVIVFECLLGLAQKVSGVTAGPGEDLAHGACLAGTAELPARS